MVGGGAGYDDALRHALEDYKRTQAAFAQLDRTARLLVLASAAFDFLARSAPANLRRQSSGRAGSRR